MHWHSEAALIMDRYWSLARLLATHKNAFIAFVAQPESNCAQHCCSTGSIVQSFNRAASPASRFAQRSELPSRTKYSWLPRQSMRLLLQLSADANRNSLCKATPAKRYLSIDDTRILQSILHTRLCARLMRSLHTGRWQRTYDTVRAWAESE